MTDEELRDLQERSQLVADLTQHGGWQLLVDRANLGLWAKQNLVIGGGAKDYEQYKTAIAWMEGAQFVLAVPMLVEQELELELAAREEERLEAEAEAND